MRMRAKPWVKPELSNCPYYVDTPEDKRGHWRGAFKNPDAPLYLELGCGKGVSTVQMAHANRDANYIGVDLISTVLGVARRNAEREYGANSVDNLLFTHFDIMWISKYFAPEDRADGIYISFCNPWNQRVRQAKKRLTHTRQLMQYRDILAPGACVYFKTDDDTLFEDSREYFRLSGFEETYITRDLHASGYAPNYESEHEKLFSSEGVPVKFLIARMAAAPQINICNN